jgi:hypothetical protein
LLIEELDAQLAIWMLRARQKFLRVLEVCINEVNKIYTGELRIILYIDDRHVAGLGNQGSRYVHTSAVSILSFQLLKATKLGASWKDREEVELRRHLI